MPLGVGPRHSHLLTVALLHFYPLLVLTALGFVSIKEGFPCKPLSVTAPHPSDEKVATTQTLRAIHGPVRVLESFIKAAGGKMGSADPWRIIAHTRLTNLPLTFFSNLGSESLR